MNSIETTPSTGSSIPRRGPAARVLRALLALGIGLVLAFGACEAGFRFLLFSDSGLALRYGAALRNAGAYSNSKAHSDYFKLRYLWRDVEGRNQKLHNVDPRVGWIKGAIAGSDLDHEHRTLVKERRPVLMYGDSFTACTTSQWDCWEGLIENSFLGEEVCVVNYGVRGYGVDQVYVLLDSTIDLWKDQDPVVAVGILADDDLDRVVFEFREGPKPRFELEDGNLVGTYPGEYEDIPSWLEEHPPQVWSYLLRYLTVGQRMLPASFGELHNPESQMQVRRKKEISAALIRAIRERLEGAGVDYFFIVFEGPFVRRGGAWVSKQTWRVRFLKMILDEYEIPWVSSERSVREHQAKHGREGNAGYFVPDNKPDARHFTALGNKAAFNAILRALHGIFDGQISNLERQPSQAPPSDGR
jgi:hypothetical protein